MSEGVWVLLVALVAATAFGLYRAARDGRFRGTHPVKGAPATDEHEESVLDGAAIEHELGERATLLQFSSAFCAPCRATRRVLHEVAEVVPGVVHVEVDAEHHLDLVRRLGILRTPAFAAAEDLRAGRLIPVLCNYEPEEIYVHAVYPHARHLAAKVRAFVDFLAQRYAGEPEWHQGWS